MNYSRSLTCVQGYLSDTTQAALSGAPDAMAATTLHCIQGGSGLVMTPSHLRTNSAEGPYRRVTVSDVTLHHSTAVCSHTAPIIACSSAGRLTLHDQALVWTLLPLMQQVRRSVRHRCVVVRIATRAGGVDNARSNNKHTVLPKKLS